MRIGILTLPLHTNYGGILQAYALQTVLERIGHEVVVLDKPKKITLPFWRLPLSIVKRTIMKCFGSKNRILYFHHINKTRACIAQYIQPFIDANIHRREIRSFKELKETEFDAIIVGGDQIWRPMFFKYWGKDAFKNVFLAFAHRWNIKRIAYAASMGTVNWEYNEEQTEICKSLIKEFDVVSVREESGVNLCQKYFETKAIHVLDPTMLLNIEDYISLFLNSRTPKSKGTLLNYILDFSQGKSQMIENVAKQMCLIPFSVNNPYEYDDSKPMTERVKVSVETWLRGFYDAEFIITDSFHACVFSILFKKQFVVVGNEKRGMARFLSLLKMFGLENRLVEENTDITIIKPIDYDEVYRKYDYWKEVSFSFLHSYLK